MKTFTIGKKKIVLKEEWMVGFITTWIVGLLAHAYRFFNFLPIWDSIYNFTGVGSTYTLGRWFLGYAGLITSMFDLPWVNGAFSLFYISIVVILLTEMFEIKNKGMIVLCAAIFVSFPTVVSSFAYMYTADAYLLAFLLATLAVYLTWCVKKWGTIAGMVCLAFAMGIYQAYATVAIVLVLLYIIRQFVIEKLDFLEAVRKDLKYLGMLVGGAVLYAVILKITLIRYNITLPGYQGIGALGIMSLGQYKAALQKTLYHFRLILAGLGTRFTASRQADAVADSCYAFLRETKKALATVPEDIPDGSAEMFHQQIMDYDTETQQKRAAGLLSKDALTTRLQVLAVLRGWEGELRRANAAGTQEAFDLLRGQFQSLADAREKAQQAASAALEAAFDFMEQALAESQEMVVFVTELTVNPASHQFLTENGCERYFKYNKDLLLDHRKAALQQELAAEQRRHGSV